MKKHPTRFNGYYITENEKVYHEPNKCFDGKNKKDLVEVRQLNNR